MTQKEICHWLQLFHALEMNQVALYSGQAILSAEEVDKRMFRRVAEIEQEHVENTLDELLRRGGTPTLLSASAAPLIGGVLGVASALSLHVALYTDIKLENMAINHYELFISQVDGEKELQRLLWSNCLDESLHTEWFKSRLNRNVDKLPL